jgi:hypothetical protein
MDEKKHTCIDIGPRSQYSVVNDTLTEAGDGINASCEQSESPCPGWDWKIRIT